MTQALGSACLCLPAGRELPGCLLNPLAVYAPGHSGADNGPVPGLVWAVFLAVLSSTPSASGLHWELLEPGGHLLGQGLVQMCGEDEAPLLSALRHPSLLCQGFAE